MSTVELRQFAAASETTKSDRLLRAAISAFCSILRPSRQEIAQIEDLAPPLLPHASRETMRFVCAALSECLHPPAMLVRRLCTETIDICAPLLVRSSALRDIDLVTLIGRHGLSHALAIERRRDLNPRIAALITALRASHAASLEQDAAPEQSAASGPTTLDRLREMMLPALERSQARWAKAPSPYLKLRSAALTGNAAIMRVTLSSLLGISDHLAENLLADQSSWPFQAALKRLGLSAEEAYVVASATQPRRFADTATIRAFFDDYARIPTDVAVTRQSH